MGMSRATAQRWVRRPRTEDGAGLHDWPSWPTGHTRRHTDSGRRGPRARPRPHRPDPGTACLDGPPQPDPPRAAPPGLARPSERHPDPPPRTRYTRRVRPRRTDAKKLGRAPDGGGYKVLGRQAGRATRSQMGFNYTHSAVDDHTRLAHSEIHDDEKVATCAGFLTRAAANLPPPRHHPHRTLPDEMRSRTPDGPLAERGSVADARGRPSGPGPACQPQDDPRTPPRRSGLGSPGAARGGWR